MDQCSGFCQCAHEGPVCKSACSQCPHPISAFVQDLHSPSAKQVNHPSPNHLVSRNSSFSVLYLLSHTLSLVSVSSLSVSTSILHATYYLLWIISCVLAFNNTMINLARDSCLNPRCSPHLHFYVRYNFKATKTPSGF